MKTTAFSQKSLKIKYWSGLFLGGLLVISSLQGSYLGAQKLDDKIEVEKKIEARLTDKVSPIIAPELFRIIVNAKVQEVKERIVLEGETSSSLDASAQKKQNLENNLPGFQAESPKPAEGEDKVKQASKSRFKENVYVKLENIDVHLLIDTSIAKDKTDLIEKIVREDLNSASLGANMTLDVKQLALFEHQLSMAQQISAWFSRYLGQKGGTALDLLYIVALVLIFIIAIVTLVLRYRSSQIKAGELASKKGERSGGGVDKNEESPAIERILNRLVEFVSKNPLEVSYFMKQLKNENKLLLLEATKTPALRLYFQQLMACYDDGAAAKSGKSDKEIKENLVNIERDIERFLKIQHKQLQQPFGYLPLIDDAQLLQLVESTGTKLKTIATLARFLAKPQYVAILDKLTLDEKVEIFKLMQTYKPTEEEIETLDVKLRTRFERVKDHIAVLVTNKEELEREFLENDTQITEVIAKLAEENFPLGPAYEKYKVTFPKLLAFDIAVVREVMAKVPNEILAKAFVKQTMNAAVKESLGDIRGRLVDSLKNRYTNLDPEEVKKAQMEVLKAYWSMI